MEDRKEWLLWRRLGIGSSDAPCIHNRGFKTPLELYEEKIAEGDPEEKSSYIMEKGNRLEPIARNRFGALLATLNEIEEDVVFEARRFVSANFDFMRASLDGYCEVKGQRLGIEVKYMGAEAHARVQDESLPVAMSQGEGRVPFGYWIQMQHQMFVADLHEMYFVSIQHEHEPLHWVGVARDENFMSQHVKACADFWCRNVLKKRPPELTDDDYKELRKRGARGLAKRLERILERKKALETEEKEIKAALVEMVDHKRMRCGALRLVEIERAGAVDYSKVPQLKGVDLEPYRKAPTRYVQIALA